MPEGLTSEDERGEETSYKHNCRTCGAVVGSGDNYCSHCGARLPTGVDNE